MEYLIHKITLLLIFICVEVVVFYLYSVAMKRLQSNAYSNIEMTAVTIVEEEEEKIDPEEQKAYIEGQILIPEPEILLYYEV
tara:strand:- start:5380 stop:5625 length:246 start_codon:yes stop_codon:yes gene_type:complete